MRTKVTINLKCPKCGSDNIIESEIGYNAGNKQVFEMGYKCQECLLLFFEPKEKVKLT